MSCDLQSSRKIKLLHTFLNCRKSWLEMGNPWEDRVEIMLLFITLQFSISIPRWFYLKRIFRFLEENRDCVNTRSMHLSGFASIAYRLRCQKKKKKSGKQFLWQRDFCRRENPAFHLGKNKFSAILRLKCEFPNYNNL